ncbi:MULTISPECIES: TetR/AcrR family transcriptional regulator [Desulfobacula]|uniref:Transcriptional regulator, TetR family n=2 Tax=Desulfobacula TaxID=28222 RepID=K0NEF6_DESTT|nr:MULTISPECIES: TetR/AcrR family transcriptional regulator [Desulfobacula]CCK79280.1 transcriptional regulator, TetR family [Desulfobacula toluolica Tol2]SDT83808.1 transcriptional regulator, TetR family [Desulfobacula phenolica]
MKRKQAILETATILFSRNGYRETSTAELSKIIGIAEGTIFYHFKNKETLFLSVLEHTREMILEEFENYMEKQQFKNGMNMIESSIAFHLYLAGKMENQFLLLHRYYPYQMAQEFPECRRNLEAIYDCLVSIYENAIETGQKDGSIDFMPSRKTALIIFSMVDGVVRFKTYNLYDASALFNDMIIACKKILKSNNLNMEGID